MTINYLVSKPCLREAEKDREREMRDRHIGTERERGVREGERNGERERKRERERENWEKYSSLIINEVT